MELQPCLLFDLMDGQSPQASSWHCFDSVILALTARRILSSGGEQIHHFCLELKDYGPNSNHKIYKLINTEE